MSSRVTNVGKTVSIKKISGLFFLWVIVMSSGLSVIYSTYKSRQLQNELEQLRRQANDLHVEWNEYLLEYSAWAAYGHVEVEAESKLKMAIPDADKIVVLKH